MLQAFDIIGPIMIGPSSSHTAGAVRIGKYARSILGGTPVKAHIRFSGSFAKTYKGHGTDKAVIAGILGMDTDDARIRVSMDVAKEEGLTFEFEEADIDGAHPNTAEITLEDAAGRTAQVQGASVGGGNIVINKINGTAVAINGKSDTLVIPHQDIPGMIAVVTKILAEKGVNVHGFSLCRDHKGGTAVMTIEIDGDINESVQDAIVENPHIFSCTILKAI
ncbi:L-serine ammonia-lyase, iron-sulfur-dependent subunit beta [Anaerotignum sp.]|uniref:L-serine ammonia-lyase, iron-sulfur-dependent subunit beta n=1 Tax=Anaerotignum sp. TaxID=2039241 RepID=UPI002A917A3A|nr:L-serine ammonia-lyase, iron-sulfur-dependent subunit beta [Anaerotignum sp.]MCI7657516.1 L-serine ammonia-lyase, iron-sulfur-dependent subunit beta [Clostridia bacterium]MDY5415295.1 L-serine ammonia-lyase, iron-sulfur-dependent subunit beta [Anaerotignum sp.]